ncbi:MAG: DNA-binding proteins Bright/BRCAA1/RBP1 and proteins containing BRIGHT domain [Chrysothrix sp. TS-e1954]|nr:MAG: DNA-binding proteins Bright/BRCAA1/RBP1 and proteins containing BRIGHT domain [Chrysothrix sp. TS-e1954]
MDFKSSSISKAFSNDAESINIPKPGSVQTDWSKGAAFTGHAPDLTRHSGLPTPPNSISPNFPAHGLSARVVKEGLASPPSQVDSDIDLQDAMDHAHSQDRGAAVATQEDGNLDEYGNITPLILAKHHLPGIVLDKGPIAIRHVMNHLSTTLPGFADIPPAKARRIVVSALESRNGGGALGDVQFEKVGWGRWHARIGARRGSATMHPIQEASDALETNRSSIQQPSAAVEIPGAGRHAQKSRRLSHGSWTGESTSSTRSEQGDRHDVAMMEHDVDGMDIDDDHTATLYRPSMRKISEERPFYSDTDEEDWSSIGAAALRANSYSSGGSLPRGYISKGRSRTRSPFSTTFNSLPAHKHRTVLQNNNTARRTSQQRKSNFTALDFNGIEADSQEREAIEALMKMGSM